MKIRKTIYLVLGILFLIFYLLVLFTVFTDFKPMLKGSGGISFFAGSQLWAIPPFLFFRASYRLKKKIDRKNREVLVNAFTELASNQ